MKVVNKQRLTVLRGKAVSTVTLKLCGMLFQKFVSPDSFVENEKFLPGEIDFVAWFSSLHGTLVENVPE